MIECMKRGTWLLDVLELVLTVKGSFAVIIVKQTNGRSQETSFLISIDDDCFELIFHSYKWFLKFY